MPPANTPGAFLPLTEPFHPLIPSLSSGEQHNLLAQTAEPRYLWAGAGAAPRDQEEALWVARARTNDAAAFRWLLERYRRRAVRLAAHVLRRDGEAEDVAQDAFVQAFRALGKLRRDDNFGPWLFQIVVRRCLDRRRMARWQGEALGLDHVPETPTAPPEGTDTRLLIEALLDQLSPPLRAALVLREMEGFEYEEIAQTLGVPVGTVRSRLHAARAQFRTLWEAANAEEEQHHA